MLKEKEIKELQEQLKQYSSENYLYIHNYQNSYGMTLGNIEEKIIEVCKKLEICIQDDYSFYDSKIKAIDKTLNDVVNSIYLLNSNLAIVVKNINDRLSDIENKKENLILELSGIE